jgi:hypothetical protein
MDVANARRVTRVESTNNRAQECMSWPVVLGEMQLFAVRAIAILFGPVVCCAYIADERAAKTIYRFDGRFRRGPRRLRSSQTGPRKSTGLAISRS